MVVKFPSWIFVVDSSVMVSNNISCVLIMFALACITSHSSLSNHINLCLLSGKHETCTVGPDNSPICACKPGYIQHPDYGCVDEHPPLLHIRPYPGHSSAQEDASLTRLIQGDKYEEYGVDIVDDNAEEYLRSLKIEYSRPLPRGCLLEMGQFKVNYTVATPWTTPDHASAQRTVVIENVNECAIRKNVGVGKACPELVAMCDVESGAQCVDEIGTYTCKCPMGTEGDGFLPIARLRAREGGGYSGILVPRNYGGGTGCRDTSKPVIELMGPNPKKLSVTKVGRLEGDYRYREEDGEMSAKIESVRAERRSYYENEIRVSVFYDYFSALISPSSQFVLCQISTSENNVLVHDQGKCGSRALCYKIKPQRPPNRLRPRHGPYVQRSS